MCQLKLGDAWIAPSPRGSRHDHVRGSGMGPMATAKGKAKGACEPRPVWLRTGCTTRRRGRNCESSQVSNTRPFIPHPFTTYPSSHLLGHSIIVLLTCTRCPCVCASHPKHNIYNQAVRPSAPLRLLTRPFSPSSSTNRFAQYARSKDHSSLPRREYIPFCSKSNRPSCSKTQICGFKDSYCGEYEF